MAKDSQGSLLCRYAFMRIGIFYGYETQA